MQKPSSEPDFGINVDPTDQGYVWEDLTAPINPDTKSGASYTLVALTGTAEMFMFAFDTTNDASYLYFHIPHWIHPGTGVFFHVHVFIGTTAGSGVIDFELAYLHAPLNAAYTPGTLPKAHCTSGTLSAVSSQSFVLETPSEYLAGQLQVDDVLAIRIRRLTVANGGADTFTGANVYVSHVDLHIRKSKFGTMYRSKTSSPNGSFYF